MRFLGVRLAVAFAVIFFCAQQACAAFSLSVTPYEGGYDIRFGKTSVAEGRLNKELTVTIRSDIGRQYRLLESFVQQPATLEGALLPPGALVVYGIRGSNKFGTMNVEEEVPVMLNRQVLYTSNQTGESDSFTLVYGFLPSLNIAPGFYKGRLAFILEPIDAAQEPVTVFLDISVDYQVESAIKIRTEIGGKDIVLQADREDKRTANVVVDIEGGYGKQFRILQLVEEQPVSAEGKLLEWGAVAVSGEGAQKGTVVSGSVPLSPRQETVYTSSLQGAADSFLLHYSLGDLSLQNAGRYRSRIKYILEGMGFSKNQLLETLNLEVENPRVFDLVIYPENQKGTIEFANLRPTDEQPKKNEVVIEVRSNAGRQYQVTQNVYSDLVNKEGEAIRAKYFNLRMEGLETKGTMRFPNAEPVQKGSTVLFVSDKKGSPDRFKVIYELAPSRDLKSGDYSTKITYSLSEI